MTLESPPEEALDDCVIALIRAGFKNVRANEKASLLTAEKRARGQWTKSQVVLTVRPEDSGSVVTATAGASAQSLSSLVVSPSQRLVDSALAAIRAC